MARRTRQQRRDPIRPKPVEKIELSEKHLKLRTVLMIIFLIVGASFIAVGVSSCFGAETGWSEIRVSAAEANCGEDFTFFYELGESGISASAESKAVSALYSQAAVRAYQLFTGDVEYEDVHNMAYLNKHPNEEVEVDEALYHAFSQIQEAGDRSLYLAPVYAQYENLFHCSDDSQTGDFDPYKNPELAAEYAEAAGYANDPEAVDLELLGENKVRLKVSDQYLAWAKENAVSRYVDFTWLKNAFIADYLAEALLEGGYTRGYVAAYDGFIRNLDKRDVSYSLQVYDRVGKEAYPAAVLDYTGPKSLVYLRDYGLSDRDSQRFYRYEDGTIRTAYLDTADGLCKSSRGDLLCLGEDKGCAEILLEMIPVYVRDGFREEDISALKEKQIFSVYCEDRQVLFNDPSVKLGKLYQEEGFQYQALPIK